MAPCQVYLLCKVAKFFGFPRREYPGWVFRVTSVFSVEVSRFELPQEFDSSQYQNWVITLPILSVIAAFSAIFAISLFSPPVSDSFRVVK
jgi:hypothetical protein